MKADLELKGFDKLERALDPVRVSHDLPKHVKEANQILGIWLVDQVRRAIRERQFEGNEPLTKILKNSDVPLVDHGDLLGSASYEHRGPFILDVGVLKRGGDKQIGGRGSGVSSTSSGGSGANVAAILHEGATINVTDRMRKFFRYLAYHTKGQVKPLSPKTTTIVIRPRPYLKNTIFAKRAIEKVKKEWLGAIQRTFENVK